MDYSPIVNAALHPLWWLIPLIVVIGILKLPWFKGAAGETLVRVVGRLRLPSETYRQIHNVTLQTPDGTTQIDHIVVSRFGVFVLETKHMKGWIFGQENEAQWTQSVYGNSFKFQNPLRQNYKHAKALEAVLGIPAAMIHSVIVFSGASTFKTPVPPNVVRGSSYIRYIKSFQRQVLSNVEVGEILKGLRVDALPQTYATRRQHINNVGSRLDPSAERECPRCGSPMVLRTAKQGRNSGGQFWGCSSYPRCKSVQSLT